MKTLFAALLVTLSFTLASCGDTVHVTAPCPATPDTVVVPDTPCLNKDKDKCKKREHPKKHSGEPDVVQTSAFDFDTPYMVAGFGRSAQPAGTTPGADPGDDMPTFSPLFGVGGWKAVWIVTEALLDSLFN